MRNPWRASFDDGERRRVNVGLGYAVSINQIKRFLPALRAGRLCEHGTLGATVQLAGDELIFNAIQGLSAAERAGIQLGERVAVLGPGLIGQMVIQNSRSMKAIAFSSNIFI